MSTSPRFLVVVADSFDAERLHRIAQQTEPTIDMLELAKATGADLLTYDSLRARGDAVSGYHHLRVDQPILPAAPTKFARNQRLLLALAREAWRRAADYDAIFLTGEDLAIPYAGLCAVWGKRGRCVAIGHYLNPLKKSALLAEKRLGGFIDRWVLYSHVQHLFAVERLRIPEDKLELIPFHADTRFYTPGFNQRRERDLLVAGGFERRDYATLFEAACLAGCRLELGVGSPWSRFRRALPPLPPGANNRFRTRAELRDLYRRAMAVVVPLMQTDFQAGISVATEAMAAGAPVILTRTRGLEHLLRHGVDGLYVPPGCPGAMADAVARLQAQPGLAESLGRAARQQASGAMSTDLFVQRLTWILQATARDEHHAQFHLLPCQCSVSARLSA